MVNELKLLVGIELAMIFYEKCLVFENANRDWFLGNLRL